MAQSQGIGAASPEQGGSGVKATVARYANEALQKIVKKGQLLLWGAASTPNCVPVVKVQRVDNIMEEIGSLWLKYCDLTGNSLPEELKFDLTHNRNLGNMVCVLADLNNPVDCTTPVKCPQDIPDHKKLWMPPDSKKVFRKCETKSDDCCGSLIIWEQISGPFGTPKPEESPDPIFKGISTETPHPDACLWIQTDTEKVLKKTSAGWVEI